jgi:hypothetical protein
VFAIFVISALPFLPESPRCLVAQGRTEHAAVIIARLQDKEILDPSVTEEVDEIVQTLSIDDSGTSQLLPGDMKRIILGVGPLTILQWCGINTLTYVQCPS